MYDLTMYNVPLIIKIGCKGTKKSPNMQIFVRFEAKKRALARECSDFATHALRPWAEAFTA